MGHALNKTRRLALAKRLYLQSPQGLTDRELAERLGVDRTIAFDYRKELGATKVATGRYTLEPTEEDIALALVVLQRAHG